MERYEARRRHIGKLLGAAGISQMIISEAASIGYFTGTALHSGERMGVLLLGADGEGLLIVNRLFQMKDSAGVHAVYYEDGRDGIALLASEMKRNVKTGIDKRWPAGFLLRLMEFCRDISFVDGSVYVDAVRAVKDREEQELMREASRVNDRCMEALIDFLHEGVTEEESAVYIRRLYREEECEDVSFAPIISFGIHGTDPHHSPDRSVLKKGDPVLIDIGAKKNGYCSDMSRSFCYLEETEGYGEVYDIVLRANRLAESMIRPGIQMKDLDEAARSVIENAGYGRYFTHRLGHFIGQVDHEALDVSGTNCMEAEPGMIFSIEPGIYLPGKFGIRIEDLVLVTEKGAEILNHVTKRRVRG